MQRTLPSDHGKMGLLRGVGAATDLRLPAGSRGRTALDSAREWIHPL